MLRALRTTLSVLGLALVAAPLGCAMEDFEDVGTSDHVIEGGKDPIIFVHGCPPPGASHEMISHFLDPLMNRFRQAGYPEDYLVRFVADGAPCSSNIDFAAQLDELVTATLAATGRPRVDIVAHSMGALAVRLYIAQGGNRYVRDFASVAGAHHGGMGAAPGEFLQSIFGYPAYEGMKEMFPPYACAGEAAGGAADIQFFVNGCLTPTGRTTYVDETLNGGVDYLSIRNSLDDTVIPVESACLNQKFQNDCSDSKVNAEVTVGPVAGPCPGGLCPPHVAVLWDPAVLEMVYAHLAHPDDGDDSSSGEANDDDSD